MTKAIEPTLLIHATSSAPGAIAILHLVGAECGSVLNRLTDSTDWPIGRMRLANFAGIDEGLAVRLRNDLVQLMPHGGPRVVQRLSARLLEIGVTIGSAEASDPRAVYPEAQDLPEALMLATLAKAASPLAIDALLAQPPRWRELYSTGGKLTEFDLAASRQLDRLVSPPIVVVAGDANVGKSTLSNALLGRAMSIASSTAGTTRDYVAGRIDVGGLTVDWHDTPGLRSGADAIEDRAIAIAINLMAKADLLIAMRDAEHDWPNLPRDADLFVCNKEDEADDAQSASAGRDKQTPLRISAVRSGGLAQLTQLVREFLVPSDVLQRKGVWLFDGRLMEHSH